ncbi:MAG: peptidylprolyl isomerase [Desulfocapsaceae bacterium]|nr:peptidylprolyl isomerase [Desulfocapsaceae bacterium]
MFKRIYKATSIFFLVIFFMVSIFSSSTGFCQSKPVEEDNKDKVIARVNDKPIKESTLTPEVNKNLKKYSKFGVTTVAPELLLTLKKKALNKIINDEVLAQASQKYDIPDIEQKLKEELASQKKRYKTPEEFEQFLKAKHLSEEELLISLRRKLQMNAYLDSVGVLHCEPTKEEILAYYEQGKENFKKKEKVKVRHILVQVEENSDQAKQETARQKAESILKKIQAGQDFATLAEEQSDCLRSKKQGGELDFVERGFMPPEFDDIAFSIEKERISEVIKTKYGYHILQVLEKDPAGYLSLDQVRDYIKKYLEERYVSRLRLEHVDKLRKEAKIEIFLN